MSLIINFYKKNFLVRYDFDEAIPYYSETDFKGLQKEEGTFINSNSLEIHYFSYYYKPIKFKKIILFLPGIGPGHKAYLKEINEFALKGYKVITLDYQGCGYSQGRRMPSINQPTKDVMSLLTHLKLEEEIVLVGHSLGAYTALNIINKVNKIKRAVIISGFLNVKDGMIKFVKSNYLASKIAKFENKSYPDTNNLHYLKGTTDQILFVHSTDDPKASYKKTVVKTQKLDNPNLSFLTVNQKRHNPNYTVEAVKYKNEIINKYFFLLRKGKLKTLEERKAYFKDVTLEKLTAQDKEIIFKITNFIG